MNTRVVSPFASAKSAGRQRPVRVLTAVPICDGHDSPIITINLELVRAGVEVIYLGYHRSVRDIVRAAIQEDVQAIGLSSYNGGHGEFFGEVLDGLRRAGAAHVGLFGGGGGTITPEDAQLMKRRGVDEIFFAGTPLASIVEFVKRRYVFHAHWKPTGDRHRGKSADLALSRLLTHAEMNARPRSASNRANRKRPIANRVIGFTGPGGAGKTTLMDELALRFLRTHPSGRLAILCHDPSAVGRGALLGDRAAMIYAQDDRVFMRSLATRGGNRGLAPGTRRGVELLRHSGFDLVLVESAGIGQEDAPFDGDFVDRQVFVTGPEYGGRLQLQKIVMLDVADFVVVNKKDLPGAKTAQTEIQQRLALNRRGQKLFSTVAKRHGDPGVDELFREVMV